MIFKTIYIISLISSAILYITVIQSSYNKLINHFSDRLHITKRENKVLIKKVLNNSDYIESIINYIKLFFMLVCPIFNTFLVLVLLFQWAEIRDEVYLETRITVNQYLIKNNFYNSKFSSDIFS